MDNIAPHIIRKRLLAEGIYSASVDKLFLETFLNSLAQTLGMRTYSDPVVFQTPNDGVRKQNQGFDGFVPLFESGISVYTWDEAKLVSLLVYSCRAFDTQRALEFFRQEFVICEKIPSMEF